MQFGSQINLKILSGIPISVQELNIYFNDSLISYNCKEIQPVHSERDQPWNFFGGTDAEAETPVLLPPDVKNWLIWKDPDDGKDWRQEEKGMTEDEMVGWHHWFNGYEFE